MGIRLKQEGFYDFTIFERGPSVGGVWRANTYPGAACDVPSHLYSLSFAPGHRWSRRYAPQAEILEYLNGVADEFGLRPHIKLEHGGRERRLRRGLGHLGGRRLGRQQRALRRGRHRLRPADEPGGPRDRRRRGLRGRDLPLGRMGPRPRPRRRARRRDRHRRQRDPVRATGRRAGRPPRHLPALSAVDPGQAGPRLPGVGAEAHAPLPGPRGAAASGAVRVLRARHLRVHRHRLPHGRHRQGRRPLPEERARRRPRVAREGHAATTRWAASGSSSRATGTRR